MAIPTPALILGWAGVIPFAALSVATFAGLRFGPDPRFALLIYGAVILSFMGGAQWGLTSAAPRGFDREWQGYVASVLPALIAWAAVLVSGLLGFMILAACFAVLLTYDLWTVRAGTTPGWYGKLRIQLTCAVVPLLALAIF